MGVEGGYWIPGFLYFLRMFFKASFYGLAILTFLKEGVLEFWFPLFHVDVLLEVFMVRFFQFKIGRVLQLSGGFNSMFIEALRSSIFLKELTKFQYFSVRVNALLSFDCICLI